MAQFSEDEIRRTDLPEDVFGILHDLAWSHLGQAAWKWESMIDRAQNALRGIDPYEEWKNRQPITEQRYVYRWNRQGRRGQECSLMARGTRNSCLLRFDDGYLMITSRNALKKASSGDADRGPDSGLNSTR